MNRILWNRRPRGEADAGEIDEVVLSDVETVHIEQMDSRCWWIGISLKNGQYWAGNFTVEKRHMEFSQQESDVVWGADEEHSDVGY